ncbi:hypothetical protein Ctha_1316 [Sporocytophaga myxococcoides]|uniref:DUF2147 domain-containing protein n=1 Tax=Sporocytophaga myxococcoides TaxID=153721 RepID=A0A098LBY8_9BACT|nr:DUF2147 domain-containing protein [Sporocytophaga myxococcoides]GAL84446.1 hypothetical protein Ctha_1316 [Sporocytophaga myxococcoides]
MKKIFALFLLALSFTVFSADSLAQYSGDEVIGIWETPGDDNGRIEIFKSANKYYGKIIWLKRKGENGEVLTDKNNPNKALQNRPIIGAEILKGFVFNKDEDRWEDGEIYDPKSGNTYSCQISLQDKNTMKVRGYIGFSLIGRTEYWKRVK